MTLGELQLLPEKLPEIGELHLPLAEAEDDIVRILWDAQRFGGGHAIRIRFRPMKTRLAFLFALLPLSVLAGTIPGLTSKVLDNGLEVIVIENHAVPLATVEIAVKSGSFVESHEYNRLSHLYAHMFFYGNKVIPNQEKYLKRLNELGASWNGSTATERVNYHLT